MILLLVASLIAGAADASLPGEAETALRRASSRYAGSPAYAAAFTQIYTPAGFTSARRESGTIWIQPPQRLRFDYEAPEKKVFTYDAGEGRFYSPADRQLTVHRLTREERARLPLVFLSSPAELAKEYAISAEPGPGGVERLTLTPRSPRPELAWLRFDVAADGSVGELSYQDAAGDRTEFRFENWQPRKARPPEDYRATGPKGTTAVEQ